MHEDLYKHSPSLARGATTESLRDISDRVVAVQGRFSKTLRRVGAEPTTRKGAKRILTRMHKELSPICLAYCGIDVPNTEITMGWVLPEISKDTTPPTLELGSVVATIPKNDSLSINMQHTLSITHHALARMLQRNDNIGDIEWATIKEQLQYPLCLLWPVVLASLEAKHKQVALPAQNGLLVGGRTKSGIQIKTYIPFPLGKKWEEVHDIYANALLQTMKASDNSQFIWQCSAVGITTEEMLTVGELLTYEFTNGHRQVEWMKEDKK